jgi:hypothetical protein
MESNALVAFPGWMGYAKQLIRPNSVGPVQWQEAKLAVVVVRVLCGWWFCDEAPEPCLVSCRGRHLDASS